MENKLIVFEDDRFEDFYPLTYLRPTFFLRPGIRYLFERILDYFPGYSPFLFCRPEIADIVSETTSYPVNKFQMHNRGDLVLVNGRIKISKEFVQALKAAGKNAVLTSGGNVAAIKIIGGLTPEENSDLLNGELGSFAEKIRHRSESMELDLSFYNYLWDIVGDIDNAIADDFEFLKRQTAPRLEELKKQLELHGERKIYPGVDFINPGSIYIAPDAEILPGNVVDASKGPIFIGNRARIEPFSYVIGPVYVGKETILVGGRIAGSSIGPVCRVGGELEESIIQGYSNKYHAGFIGHSYIGEWINLGAMTTNSDLKNNYAPVKVSVNGKDINSGSLKVGSFIGDFTKTAIGTLLNTGINIGIVCNIISEGLLVSDREIPPFTWLSSRHKMDYSPAKAIDTIERTMARRGKELTVSLRQRLMAIAAQKADKTKGL
jgi:UDP-N-acetylglucosamine diphosphorylase/glucosamine-1-phosphate N-acetyltransferase